MNQRRSVLPALPVSDMPDVKYLRCNFCQSELPEGRLKIHQLKECTRNPESEVYKELVDQVIAALNGRGNERK